MEQKFIRDKINVFSKKLLFILLKLTSILFTQFCHFNSFYTLSQINFNVKKKYNLFNLFK